MEKTILDLQYALMLRENLPVCYAGTLAASVFTEFDARVREGAMLWLDGRLPRDFAVGGISVGELIEDVEASEFGALCMLDLFARHPEEAGQATWVRARDFVEVNGDAR